MTDINAPLISTTFSEFMPIALSNKTIISFQSSFWACISIAITIGISGLSGSTAIAFGNHSAALEKSDC